MLPFDTWEYGPGNSGGHFLERSRGMGETNNSAASVSHLESFA